jgi:acetyl esterase/lipase
VPEDRSVLDRSAPPPDRTWAYGPGPDQVADLYLQPGGPHQPARASIVLVHGGYWRPEYDRTHLRPMAAALSAAGHRVALVEFARTPGRPDDSLTDIRLALGSIEEALGPGRPVLVGHSAGGHLALVAATTTGTQAAACLALAPVADLLLADALDLDDGAVRAFLGTAATERPDLDPTRLPPAAIPVTVVHGVDDSLVPLSVSASYCGATGAPLVTLSATGHFELIDPTSPTWSTVLGQLAALAARSGIE